MVELIVGHGGAAPMTSIWSFDEFFSIENIHSINAGNCVVMSISQPIDISATI